MRTPPFFKTDLLLIGGSDAGLSAALRAREVNPASRPLMLLADEFPNFSICGLPFYLSREVPDYWHLAHRTRAEIEALGIEVRTSTRALGLEPQTRTCRVRRPDGREEVLAYENAVIGTGYINLELADGLTRRRLKVTMVERNPSVLKTVDPPFGRAVERHLEAHGVTVLAGQRAQAIERRGGDLVVSLDNGKELSAELVIVATGARPQTALAEACGVDLGEGGAIRVNPRMETNLAHVYAAGDCAETRHRLLGRPTYLPLGSTAHKQGRVAGENAAGGSREFLGTLGTQVVKAFNLIAARTGFKDDDARRFGFDPFTVAAEHWDHKVYYPGAKKIAVRLTGDRRTGQLLGVQLLGEPETLVAKRIDAAAAALFARLGVDELSDLDLSYSPPLDSPWDPLQATAQQWLKGQRENP